MNVKHHKKLGTKHKKTKANLQNTCLIIIRQKVDVVSTKEQANAKHKKKPRTKHIRRKTNLQITQIKHIIIKCAKV
jgi:hypothetical protein